MNNYFLLAQLFFYQKLDYPRVFPDPDLSMTKGDITNAERKKYWNCRIFKMMSSFNNFWNAENYMHVNWDFNNMDILNHDTGYSFQWDTVLLG